MTWVLFDNADATMMLVKKKNNGPKRKPAARDLQDATTLPTPVPQPPLPTSNTNNAPAYTAQTQAQASPLPFEPPPPYSPRQYCHCDHGFPKTCHTDLPPPPTRIPPPLPPRDPVRDEEPVKIPSSFQLGKSCPDLARLVAKSVQNVKESMHQEQAKNLAAEPTHTSRDSKIPKPEKRPIARMTSDTDDKSQPIDQRSVLVKPSPKGPEKTFQEHEKAALIKSIEIGKPTTRSKPDQKVASSKASTPQTCLDELISTKPKLDQKVASTKASTPQTCLDELISTKPKPDQKVASTKAFTPQTGLEELISTKLDIVLTSIDGEAFSGDEKELDVYDRQPALRGGWGSASKVSQGANRAISSTIVGINYFKKASLYANSKLPLNLPSLRLYMPSYPLLCLAAQYSQRVYTKPSGKEREAHVEANWKMGTKAMVIKSVPVDDMNTIVFAIRGSQTFMDWAVNLNSAPVSPGEFLDDSGNLCHSGFLSVARKMIKPVASRLRSLLEEDPSRSSCSLLMTGHSAGGAVASLLYAHMLATDVKSELNILTGCFKRIHCLTFGAPPVSLLPLAKPSTGEARLKKSLFLSFINEGDPVPRADKAYIRSLLDLYTSPSPSVPRTAAVTDKSHKCTLGFVRPKTNRANSAPATISAPPPPQYVWSIPPGALSNAGRLVVLRGEKVTKDNLDDDVKAEITTDQQLREVVFGDPVMHMMKVYARRIEVLATKAVTAKVWG